MSKISFDHVIDRTNTQSIRWDKYGPEVIPLWVADMDFSPPESVIEALQDRIHHGVFGYTHAGKALKIVIQKHIQQVYGWRVESDWIEFLPSVVTGLHLSVRNLTDSTDHVLIPHPSYHHFKDAVVSGYREYSEYDMGLQNGRYIFDIKQLESLVKPNTRLLMICNPHNPGGTVYNREELESLAAFAKKHQIIISSDEIHADLILDPQVRHLPIGSIDQEIAQNSFSLMSLNKAYNFPGIGLAWMVCPNPRIRESLLKDINTLIPHPNLFAYVATKAALEGGSDWHQELINHLRSNHQYLLNRINSMPGLSMEPLQATYLAWIDARGLERENPFEDFLKGGVALSPGQQFGESQYVRLNFGTTRQLLEKALDRMEKTCHLLQSNHISPITVKVDQ
jgi:aminotransferase/cystathionine beta-lyase